MAVRAGALFAVLGLLLLLAKPASAHALLLGTSPAAGARVPHAPATVVLTFDEAVVVPPGAVRVLDGSGANVAQGAAFHPDGVGARVAVRSARLQPGRYVVAWRVVSDDGHIVSGAFAFGIGEDAGDVPATVVQAQVPGAAAILAVLHFCLLAGILVGAGLFAGALLAARPGATIAPSLLGFTAWSVIGFVAFMQLFVQADFAGLPIAAVLTTRYGVLRIVLIGAAIVGFRSFLVERGSTALLAAASVVAILAEAFAGHAATGMLPALGVAADVVHLAGAALWIGVLLVTLSAPRGVDVRRTSTVATWCVAAIVASAVPQALRSIPSFAALTGTEYGLLVCAKIALLLLALGFAVASRRRVPDGSAAVVPSVRIEVAVLTVVLAVTAVLVDAPPPRRVAAAQVVARTFAVDDLRATAEVSDDGGLRRTILILTTRAGAPANAAGVDASITDARSGTGPLRIALHPDGTGRYSAATALPFAGRWTLLVIVRVGPFDEGEEALPL